jgi:hypothetical protein
MVSCAGLCGLSDKQNKSTYTNAYFELLLMLFVSLAIVSLAIYILYAYAKSLNPTRERLTFDLQRLRRSLPLDELNEPYFNIEDVRRYYSSTTFRDYKLLEWATGCNAMHTELLYDRKLPYRARHLQQLMYVIAHLGNGAVVGGCTLEVGFGKGSNSIYLASLFSDAQFMGLDLVDDHVSYATASACNGTADGVTRFSI